MADKKKGKSGDKGGSAKAAEKAEEKKPKAAEKAEEKKAEATADHREAEGHDDHGHDDHAHADHGKGDHGHGGHAGGAHEHKPNIREYMIIFVVLAVLTVLEVGVAKVPGVAKVMMSLALVGLALTKAAIVALFYMHLKHETKVLKYTVALPMMAPTLYAFVLISEAMWRLHR
jgi:cytochrome c oxidase subunit 4